MQNDRLNTRTALSAYRGPKQELRFIFVKDQIDGGPRLVCESAKHEKAYLAPAEESCNGIADHFGLQANGVGSAADAAVSGRWLCLAFTAAEYLALVLLIAGAYRDPQKLLPPVSPANALPELHSGNGSKRIPSALEKNSPVSTANTIMQFRRRSLAFFSFGFFR